MKRFVPSLLVLATVTVLAMHSVEIWSQENQVEENRSAEPQRTEAQEQAQVVAKAQEQMKKNVEDKKKLQLELDGLLRDGKLERAAAVQHEMQMRHLRWQLENFDNFVAENFELRESLVDEISTLRSEVKELRKEVQSLRESLKK